MRTYKGVPINEYFVANGLTYRFIDGAVRRVHFDGHNSPPWLEDESVLDSVAPAGEKP